MDEIRKYYAVGNLDPGKQMPYVLAYMDPILEFRIVCLVWSIYRAQEVRNGP